MGLFIISFTSPQINSQLEMLLILALDFAEDTASSTVSIPIIFLTFLERNKEIVPVPQ